MLFPYLGEKSKLSNFITPNIPQNISHYVEPFGGAFGVFFSLNFSKFKSVKFIYNDINNLNWNLFKQLKENEEDFISYIKDIKIDKDYYKKSLKALLIPENNIELAKDWLITLCSSSPYEIGTDSWRGDTEFEVFKLKWKAYKYHFDKISEIENLDYKDSISKWDSPDTFFYLDPPYYGKESYYFNSQFDEASHYELASLLQTIKGRFLLSYWYFDGIEELYQNCRFEQKKTIMGTEYIIMNY